MRRFFGLFTGIFIPFSLAFSDVVTQPLIEKMVRAQTNEFIRVNAIMKEQPDYHSLLCLVDDLKPSERRQIVIEHLKEIKAKSQGRVLSYLNSMKENGKVGRIRSLWLGNALCFEATRDVIDMVATFSGVRAIDWDEERNLLIKKVATTLPVDSIIPWHVTKVRALDVWDNGYTGEDIVVSIMDTGVRYTHYDLADHIWINFGEIPNDTIDNDGNGYVDDYIGYDFFNNDPDPIDDAGHGTGVAGLVAGDGTVEYITGIAPDALIMPLKVLNNSGGGLESDCWEAIQYSIDNGAQVINMSLGWQHAWSPDRQQWRNVCNAALTAGVILSVAAGNEGDQQNQNPVPDNVRTPGDVPPPWLHPDQDTIGGLSSVVTVGATCSNDSIADYSSRGPVTWEEIPPWYDYPFFPQMGLNDPDISAPGHLVTTTSNAHDSAYTTFAGTSGAAPVAAGAMALMLSKYPDSMPAFIDSTLEITSVDLGLPGKDNTYGAGRLDCYEACIGVEERTETVSPTFSTMLQISPNPFSKKTDIRYEITDNSRIELKIYDATGSFVKQWDHPTIQLSNYIIWDGTDESNRKLPSGVYFLEFKAGDDKETKKLLLLK